MTMSQAMPENRDNRGWSYSIRCTRCQWKFRCPVEQLERVFCRKCESELEEAAAPAR